MNRRSWGLSVGTLATVLGFEGAFAATAHASTALALSLAQLVSRSDRVVLGLPVSATSSWESVAGQRRIVTRTRVVQSEDWLADDSLPDELFVVTLGGRVGDVGQKVAGEAHLQVDERCLLFVGKENKLARPVIGMGQGHYPIERVAAENPSGPKISRLARSRSLPYLVGRPTRPGAPRREQRAVDVLSGVSLADAQDLVRGAR